jgi:hypothetical protein
MTTRPGPAPGARFPSGRGYPRWGAAVRRQGFFYAVGYAAQTASELGGDVVKVNFAGFDRDLLVPAGH